MRIFKKIFFSFVLLSMLLTGLLIFFFGTTSGLHFLLNNTVRLVPGLYVASISGGLNDLKFKHLSYHIPGMTVGISELYFALDINCLRKYQFSVKNLSFRNINISISTAEFGSLSEAIQKSLSPSYSLLNPYFFNLRRLILNNVHIEIDGIHISFEEFSTGLQFQFKNLKIIKTRMIGLLIKLPKIKTTESKKNINQIIRSDTEIREVGTYLQISFANTLRTLFSRQFLSPCPLFILPLNVIFEDVEGENLRLAGDVNFLITHLRLKAITHGQHIKLKKLYIDTPEGILEVSGTAELDKRWLIAIIMNATINQTLLKGEKIRLVIDGYLLDELHILFNFSGPLIAQLTLNMHLTKEGLPFFLIFNTRFVQWPLIGTPQYKINSLILQINGQAQDYRLMLKLALSGSVLPPIDVSLDARGNSDGIVLSLLRLKMLQGNIYLKAAVNWKNTISWRSELLLNKINTSGQWPNWPLRLNGKIITYGDMYADNWSLQVPILDIGGYIQQSALVIKGSFNGNAAGQWKVPGLLLSLGRNKLVIKGCLNDTSMLNVALDAPVLNDILTGLSGLVSGDIKVQGSLRSLQMLVNLNAFALRFSEWTIQHIIFYGNFQYGKISRENIQLYLDKLSRGSFSIVQAILKLTGNEKQHQISVKIQGEPFSGQVQLKGVFDQYQQRWKGIISKFYFNTLLEKWKLSSLVVLNYQVTKKNQVVVPHYLKNCNTQTGILKNITKRASKGVNFLLFYFDLINKKPVFLTEIQNSSIITGLTIARWIGIVLPYGKVAIEGSGVKVIKLLQSKMVSIDFEKLTINAFFSKKLVSFSWLIQIFEKGQLSGQVQLKDLKDQRVLSGNIKAKNFSLAFLNPFIPQGSSIDGLVNTELLLGSNIRCPNFYGQLVIKGLVIRRNSMPFVMKCSELVFSFFKTQIILQGFISTTHGQINLTGDANWGRKGAWHVRISAKSSEIQIITPPTLHLDMSLNIVFEATPMLFALNGDINIPWARIDMKNIPQNIVGVSRDEVLLDRNLQLITKNKGKIIVPVSSNILVHLTGDVRINTFILNAKLKGDLKVVQDKNGFGLNGQIGIPSGRLHVYGQDLIVTKGQLLFSGSINQIYLNIEAIRSLDSTEDNIIVGVRATGLTDHPTVEVFSNPIKSQQEVLSYLLRGQSLSTSGVGGNIMTSILIRAGVVESGKVFDRIGEAFGVDNLILDTQGVSNNPQVIVSGYVTPNFQIRYGIGIFDSLEILTLRYRLMSQFYLEAVSGLHQSVDLLYRFEL